MIIFNQFKDIKFKKIYHVADIHIRLIKRHNEYKQVFKELYQEILKDKEDTIIYVGGDLAHAKTEISPELIQMISDFLISLSDICPTILIMGNHDINLNNPNRLDTLTPIIKLINHPNLFYLKDTDIYRFGNIDFFTYSLLDVNPFEMLKSEDSNNEYKIGLYHGTINGSTIDSNFVMKNESVKNELFDNLDMVMLGDIHKLQTLQNYEIKDNKKYPTISFSSSLIQQDYGEKYGNHGMLKWNLEKRNHEFISIENDFGYHIIKVEEGKIVELPIEFSKKPRVRVDISNTKLSQIKEIEIEIKEKYNISDFTINTTNIQNDLNENNINLVDLSNIKTADYQCKLIFEYLDKNHIDYTEDIKNEIIEINKFFNYKISENLEVLNSDNITIKELWFSNFFSYGENNYVNFEGMNNLVGLFANNAMGKSSFIQILLFILFDRTTKNSKTISILNVDKNYFHSKLKFKIRDIDYYIEKLGEKKKDESVSVKIDFYYYKNNIESDENKVLLNGKARADTNKIIGTYVGNLENSLMTIFSLQKDNDGLIGKKQTDRKLLLYKFLGIDIFEKLYNMAKDESKSERDYLKNFKKNSNAESHINLKNVISKKTIELNELEYKQTSYKESIIKLENEIKEYQTHIIYIDKILNLEELTSNKNNIEIDINTSKSLLDKLNCELEQVIQNVNNINLEIKSYNEFELQSDIDKFKINEKEINRLNTSIKGLEVSIENYKNNITNNNIQLKEVETQLLELNDSMSLLEKELIKYNEKELLENINLFKINEKSINELNTDISVLNLTIKNLQSSINQNSLQLTELNKLFESTSIKIKEIELEISKYNESELLLNIELLKTNERKLFELNSSIKELKLIIQNKEDKLIKLTDLKYDEECEFCMNNIFVKDAIETKETIEIDKTNLINIQSEKTLLETNNIKLTQSNQEYKLLVELQDDKKLLDTQYNNINSQIEQITKLISNFNLELNINNDKLQLKELDKSNLISINNKLESSNNEYQLYLNLSNKKQITISERNQLQTRLNLYESDISSNENNLKLSNLSLLTENNDKVRIETENLLLDNSIIKFNKLQELKLTKNNYKVEYQNLELKIENHNNNITNKNSILSECLSKITTYYGQQISIENNKKYQLLILEQATKLNTNKNEYDAISEKYQEDYSEVRVLESKLDELNEQLEQIKKHEQTLESYEKYMEAINKDGIPYMLMQQILPILELEINNILKQIADFYLEFKFNDSDIDINIIYPHRFKNTSWDISLTSGMESFISSIATRVALDKNSVQPKYNFLTIDEGFDVLDKVNKMNLDKLLSFITKYYDFVLVISHLEIIKDYVKDFIELELDVDGYSHINHQ
jgi:DNA repair exonuclease SbcCD ATPase subunit